MYRYKKLHILYVEDNPTDVLLLQEVLKDVPNTEFILTHVERLAEALNYLKQENFDVILLDLGLPDSNGVETFVALHTQKPNIPILVLTGTDDEQLGTKALQEGAQDYLVKNQLQASLLGHSIRYAIERNKINAELDLRAKKLAESEAQIRKIIEANPDAVIVVNFDGVVQFANPSAIMMFGAKISENLPTVLAQIKNKQPELTFTINEQETFAEMRVVEIVWNDEPAYLVSLRDVTESKRTQSQLRKFISLSPIVVYALALENGEYKHIWSSENIKNLIGYSIEEHKGAEWWIEQVHPEDRKRLVTALNEFIEKKYMLIEYRFKGKDGNYVWLRDEQRFLPSDDNNLNEIVGVTSDVTERIRLEEQFRQSQKMEAIGQLSGGVAHDFNNILTVIQGYISLLELRKSINPQIQTALEEIKLATNRAANLTRQLLLFSRRQTLQLSEVDLNEVVGQMSKMLQRILGEDIEMKYNYSSKSLPLYADIGMMDQILLNLAVNARDAMPNGGSLTITTSEIVFDKSSLPISIHAQVGKFALLTVSDTGCGIAPENINRIFEPFFTTKEVGKGTGLGLATVFGIVQQHQGWIEVSSELGKGTTFQIYLPILVKNDKKIPITDYTTEEKGNETVLIVEDEPALRILVGMYLSDLGYKVIEANNGVMALDLWKQNKNEIRLVVTDLVMPGNMSGIELAKRLQEENPKLKIIYTSGYSLEFISNNTELRKEDLFLVKPYNPLKLAEAIRLCLDS